MITGFDHYTVRCADLEASWRFYEEVLGLSVATRPGVAVPAAIASIGDVQVVHLFQATPEQDAVLGPVSAVTDPQASAWRTGRVQHVGFWAKDVEDMRARFADHQVPYRERRMADKHQYVVYDPDAVEIEINFPLTEV